MANRIIILALAFGLAGLGAIAQSGNPIGIRIGSAAAGFGVGRVEVEGVKAGFSAQVVKDWYKSPHGFVRGRLGLETLWAGSVFSTDFSTQSHKTYQFAVGVGRGHRVTHGPFALTYGADAALILLPFQQNKYNRDENDGTTAATIRNRKRTMGLGFDAGVFVEMEWNIRRNIWIGLQQNFHFGVRYTHTEERRTSEVLTIQTGVTRHLFESETNGKTKFSHPFSFTPPLFSLTFRPGAK